MIGPTGTGYGTSRDLCNEVGIVTKLKTEIEKGY